MTQKLIQMAKPVVDRCPHMIDLYHLEDRFMISPLVGDNIKRTVFGGAGFLPVSIIILVIHSILERCVHVRGRLRHRL